MSYTHSCIIATYCNEAHWVEHHSSRKWYNEGEMNQKNLTSLTFIASSFGCYQCVRCYQRPYPIVLEMQCLNAKMKDNHGDGDGNLNHLKGKTLNMTWLWNG